MQQIRHRQDRYALEKYNRSDGSPESSSSDQSTTPHGTPRRLPMLTDSRASSGETPSSSISYKSPSHSPVDLSTPKNSKNAGARNERHSLTPSLHASFVSQILTLRREVESSHDFIQRLEDFLSVEKAEKDSLQETTDSTAKELRNAKRQLQSVEDASLLALEELCRERDDAHDAADDLRLRFQEQQKKLNAQQNEMNYLHEVWEQERLAWKQDKRRMELKVEIATTKLQTAIEEFAAHNAAFETQQEHDEVSKRDSLFDEAEDDDEGEHANHLARPSRDSRVFQQIDAGSVYSTGPDPLSRNLSLADELKDDYEAGDEFDDPYDFGSPPKKAQEVRFSGVPSVKVTNMHGVSSGTLWLSKNLSNQEDNLNVQLTNVQVESDEEPFGPVGMVSVQRVEELVEGPTTHSRTESEEWSLPIISTFIPPSPDAMLRKPGPAASVNAQHARTQAEPLASIPVILSQAMELSSDSVIAGPLAATSYVYEEPSTESMEIISTMSQTEINVDTTTTIEKPKRSVRVIPKITVEPPSSRPTSTDIHVLPSWIKDAGCQTEPYLFDPTNSMRTQTETSRTNRTSAEPPETHPSSRPFVSAVQDNILSDRPAKETTNVLRSRSSITRLAQRIRSIRDSYQQPEALESRSTIDPVDHESRPDLHTTDPYSTVDEGHWARLRKSLMLSGRYAKVPETSTTRDSSDAGNSEAESEGEEIVERCRGHQRALRSRVNAPTPVPEESDEALAASTEDMPEHAGVTIDRHTQAAKPHRPATATESLRAGNDFRAFFRRPGSSGSHSIASSSARTRQSGQVHPPITIPARDSSMSLFHRRRRMGDPTESPTPRSAASSPQRRESALRSKSHMLRKTRSDAVIAERSEIITPRSATLHGVLSDDARPQYVAENKSFFGQSQTTNHTPNTHAHSTSLDFIPLTTTTSIAPTSGPNILQHSIVDAITATMVGEWMWKYVRKRKTFSFAPDPLSGGDAGGANAVRHKRWVWMSPYDRSIMWSNKQPITDVALMGKHGRKLQIQSVLDVANPVSLQRPSTSSSTFTTSSISTKKSPAIHNRSIVVLTPSGALRFTAMSAERHYLWLTALSFITQHTSQEVPDLSFLPQGPSISSSLSRTPSLRRGGSGGGGVEKRRLWGSRRGSLLVKQRPLYGTSEAYELADEGNVEGEDEGDGAGDATAPDFDIPDRRTLSHSSSTRHHSGQPTRTTSLLSPHSHRNSATTTSHTTETPQKHTYSLPTTLSNPYDDDDISAADPPFVPRLPTNSPHNHSFSSSSRRSRSYNSYRRGGGGGGGTVPIFSFGGDSAARRPSESSSMASFGGFAAGFAKRRGSSDGGSRLRRGSAVAAVGGRVGEGWREGEWGGRQRNPSSFSGGGARPSFSGFSGGASSARSGSLTVAGSAGERRVRESVSFASSAGVSRDAQEEEEEEEEQEQVGEEDNEEKEEQSEDDAAPPAISRLRSSRGTVV